MTHIVFQEIAWLLLGATAAGPDAALRVLTPELRG